MKVQMFFKKQLAFCLAMAMIVGPAAAADTVNAAVTRKWESCSQRISSSPLPRAAEPWRTNWRLIRILRRRIR